MLLYRLEDRRIQRFFMLSRYPRLEDCRRVLDALETPAALPELVKLTDLPRRRVQVILHMLRESGFIRRSRTGYRRRATLEDDLELAQAHTTFEALSKHDRSRLDEMMHYAESGKCRKQILRAYFNEEEGEPCGTCDNCRNRTIAESLPSASSGETVVEIQTAVGPVVTTAPETLPIHDEASFRSGDRIRHVRFGTGVVMDVAGDALMVRFDKGKARKIHATYVKRLRKTA